MFFHWLRDYGKGRSGATAVVNDVFELARAASPSVFAKDSRVQPDQQAKFEHMCPWLAVVLLDKTEAEGRVIFEEMVDRLEIGLREGGVGDMKVGVHVRKYAAALHGRVRRYASLMDKQDWDGLAAALTEHEVDKGLAVSLQAKLGAGTVEKAAPKPKKGLR